MKTFRPYLASVLLLLFSITFMPFNFLHHHAEDEHSVAMHRHETEEMHHCELDDHFCQPFADDCQHEQHISKTIAKCFGCEFHFIKHFTTAHFSAEFFQQTTYTQYSAMQPDQLREALILLSNKGPPAFA